MVKSKVNDDGKYEKNRNEKPEDEKARTNLENRNLVKWKQSLEMKVTAQSVCVYQSPRFVKWRSL